MAKLARLSEPDCPKVRQAYDLLQSDQGTGLAKLIELAESGSTASMVYLGDYYRKTGSLKI